MNRGGGATLLKIKIFANSNMTGATSGTGTIYPSGSPEFIFVLSGVCVVDSFVFCMVGVY
jgi:hypothetical protein